MSHTRGRLVAIVLCLSAAVAWADILVSVNVNKPVYDVNEQFVSFSIPPELLFESLDGPNKKTLSDMAALLGPSYLKLTGDYFFPSDLKSSLKNPTQSIWSGFNRWTRAMNWTMVIPVQYTPLSWDPIDALRVLNTSNSVGIDNCIWQLGLDFGASRAADYVADLNTLDTMVDTFRPYVKQWKVIGADVTAGSSAEETKRYIDLSRDVNTAFGWTQPPGYHVEENVNGYIYEKDLSLKAMMEKKVPVWLSVPPKDPINQMPNGYGSIEVSEAIRWAQTLGDAASSGFDAVFKPLAKDDVSGPSFSFFVSALFKKIMGNRVFPSKPVKRLSYASKLYTHCANGISGGIATMGINTEDYPVKISARLSAKFTGSEVWQFVLTSKKGDIYLNNELLTLNSTLEPLVRIKHPNKPLAITIPPMSVGFWVLPLANHEDCQFTELLASYSPDAQYETRQRKQTSSDRLLKKLILETSFTDQMKNRRRRDTASNNLDKGSVSRNANLKTRQRRFILKETPASQLSPSQPSLEDRNLKKREDAGNWLKALMKPVIPTIDWSLKRSRRDADFISSLFPGDSPVPVKGNIRRQSSMSSKQKYLNEASLFKAAGNSDGMDMPDGDVHFRYITGADGEEVNAKDSRESQESQELEDQRSADLSNRELPSEFYETISHDKYKSKSAAHFKSKGSDISDIEGSTRYMTGNQLQEKFRKINKDFSRDYNPQSTSSEERDKSKSVFGSEFTLKRKPTQAVEDPEKYLYQPEESDSLKKYLSAAKSSGQWVARERSRRTIDFSKLKSWQDNLITQDEDLSPLSYMVPEMSETIPEESVLDLDGKQGVAASVKSRVSKILSVVKNHLSGFFSSLIN